MNKDSKVEISVVCAWYNRSQYIRSTIESILNQDFKSFELIVVNDGSTEPEVKEILDSYNDPRLRVIHQNNTGFVIAISNAIDCSHGKYIVLQGSGDLSFPNRLKLIHETFERSPKTVLVGSFVENVLDVETGRSKIYGTKFKGDAKKEATKRILLMHGEAAYRRNAYIKVGGYRSFFTYSQDRDLWCRLSREGNVEVLDKILYRRLANIGGVSGDPKKQFLQRYFSYFSVYCHMCVLKSGMDPLKEFGVSSGLFYSPGFDFLYEVIKLSARYQKNSDRIGSKKIINYYINFENRYFFKFIAKIFSILIPLIINKK